MGPGEYIVLSSRLIYIKFKSPLIIPSKTSLKLDDTFITRKVVNK